MRIVALNGCLFDHLTLITSQVYLHFYLSLATGRDRRIEPDDSAASFNPHSLYCEDLVSGVADGELVFDFRAFHDLAKIVIGLFYLNRRLFCLRTLLLWRLRHGRCKSRREVKREAKKSKS